MFENQKTLKKFFQRAQRHTFLSNEELNPGGHSHSKLPNVFLHLPPLQYSPLRHSSLSIHDEPPRFK